MAKRVSRSSLRAGEDTGGDNRDDGAQSVALVYDPDEPSLGVGEPSLGVDEPSLGVDEPSLGVGEPGPGVGEPGPGVGEHDDAVTEFERIHEAAVALGATWREEYPEASVRRHPEYPSTPRGVLTDGRAAHRPSEWRFDPVHSEDRPPSRRKSYLHEASTSGMRDLIFHFEEEKMPSAVLIATIALIAIFVLLLLYQLVAFVVF